MIIPVFRTKCSIQFCRPGPFLGKGSRWLTPGWNIVTVSKDTLVTRSRKPSFRPLTAVPLYEHSPAGVLRIGRWFAAETGADRLQPCRAAFPAAQRRTTPAYFSSFWPQHIDLWDMKPAAPARFRRSSAGSDPGAGSKCASICRCCPAMDKLCLLGQ